MKRRATVLAAGIHTDSRRQQRANGFRFVRHTSSFQYAPIVA
jgi:hypothetical protein